MSSIQLVILCAFAAQSFAEDQACACRTDVLDNVPQVTCYADYIDADTCLVGTRSGYKNYPLDYGASCKKHIEPEFAACWDQETGIELPTEDQESWCNDPWCYVDGCTCGLADVNGGYAFAFEDTKGYKVPTAYSYSNCGAESALDPNLFGHAESFDSTTFCDQPCACLEYPRDIPRVACMEDYAVEGECLLMKDLDYAMYPADYGASCKKHLEPGHADCYNLETHTELPDGERANWCDSPFCYVDGCTCAMGDVAGGPIAYSHNWEGRHPPGFYSYNNCDGELTADLSNWGHSAFDHDEWCTGDEISCSKVKDYYRDSQCCGMPDKMVEKPTWR